jgi:aromatic ring-opening dioxygenase catalytic subunit (LigB family)
MFPEETPLDIPVILVSTYYGSDLSQQIKLGEALSFLR